MEAASRHCLVLVSPWLLSPFALLAWKAHFLLAKVHHARIGSRVPIGRRARDSATVRISCIAERGVAAW
jgi:hypothetical protein